MLVIQVSTAGNRQIRAALAETAGAHSQEALAALLAALPDGSGLWRVPDSGEAAVRALDGIDVVARGIRLAQQVARRADPPDVLRPWLARRLFDDWNPTTNPELLSAQWMSLNTEDRRFWTNRAQEYLSALATGKEV